MRVAATVRNGSQVAASAALVDSGNLYRNAISIDFARRLGIRPEDIAPLPVTSVGTAQRGASMRILGEPKRELSLMLGSHPTIIRFKPVILAGLCSEIILSGPFLQKYNIDQLHSRRSLRFQGRLIDLLPSNVSGPISPDDHRQMIANVVVEAKSVTQPRTERFIQVIVRDEARRPVRNRVGVIRGSTVFDEATGMSPVRNVVVSTDDDGRATVAVLNLLDDRPVTIQGGSFFGQFEEADVCEDLQEATALVNAIVFGEEISVAEVQPPLEENSFPNTLKEVIEMFKLNDDKVFTSEADRRKAAALIASYKDIFSADGSPGRTTLVEHEIRLLPGTRPQKDRYRPLNPILQQEFEKQLQSWLQQKLVRRSQSPWASALVPVRKKSGGVRFAIDFRRLNMATVKDAIPIGSIDDNVARLAGSTVFSVVDASNAFHHIEIKESDKYKTAFATPVGLFEWNRLPFGLTNAPATYSRLMSELISGLRRPSAYLQYVDDVICHSKDLSRHLTDLAILFEAHRRAGIKLSSSKSQLCRSSVEYLGNVVSARGVSPLPSHVETVRTWPCPRTKFQLKSFLATVNYYRRFIKNFSAIAKPVLDAQKFDLKDHEEFTPTPELQGAVERLKRCLMTAPILAYPEFYPSSAPFILDTDFSTSTSSMGAVLSQVQQGEERVIAYGGKRLNKAQAAYSTHQGELFAAIFFMQYWAYFLRSRRFILRTDHAALKAMQTLKNPGCFIIRLLDTLAGFSFDVQHRPGVRHGNADALSRATHHPELAYEETPEAEITGLAAVARTPEANTSLVEELNSSQTLSKSLISTHEQGILSNDLSTVSLSDAVKGQHATGQFVNKHISGQQSANIQSMKNHPKAHSML